MINWAKVRKMVILFTWILGPYGPLEILAPAGGSPSSPIYIFPSVASFLLLVMNHKIMGKKWLFRLFYILIWVAFTPYKYIVAIILCYCSIILRFYIYLLTYLISHPQQTTTPGDCNRGCGIPPNTKHT